MSKSELKGALIVDEKWLLAAVEQRDRLLAAINKIEAFIKDNPHDMGLSDYAMSVIKQVKP